MANTNLVELFTNIADSIRAKDGTTETIAPVDFASRIEALSVGSNEDIEWHWVKGDSTFIVPQNASSYDIRYGDYITIHIEK